MLYHVTIATYSRDALFPDPSAGHRFLGALVAARAFRVVLFAVMDDHVHVVVHCPSAAHAGYLLRMLGHHAAARLDAPHVDPVDGRRHLENLVRYVVEQPTKHGLGVHPALYEGTCFQDLVGARLLPGFDAERIWAHLPRRAPHWVAELVGVDLDADVRPSHLGAPAIWEAALAAHHATASLSEATAAARIAAVHVAAHLPARLVAHALDIGPRHVRRLALRVPDPRSLHATLTQLALRAQVGSQAPWRATSSHRVAGPVPQGGA